MQNTKTLLNINVSDEKAMSDIELRTKNYDVQLGNINQKFENKIDKIQDYNSNYISLLSSGGR